MYVPDTTLFDFPIPFTSISKEFTEKFSISLPPPPSPNQKMRERNKISLAVSLEFSLATGTEKQPMMTEMTYEFHDKPII